MATSFRKLFEQIFRGGVSSPGSGLNSEQYGEFSNANGDNGTCVGNDSRAAEDAAALGTEAKVFNTGGTALGRGTTVNGDYGIAIGATATASNNECVVASDDVGKGVERFAVLNGGGVSPLKASANPAAIGADNRTGLFIACQVSGVVVFRQVVFDGVTGVLSIVP